MRSADACVVDVRRHAGTETQLPSRNQPPREQWWKAQWQHTVCSSLQHKPYSNFWSLSQQWTLTLILHSVHRQLCYFTRTTVTYTFNCSVLCTVISSVQYLAGQAVTSIIILIIPIHHQNIPMACYVAVHSPQLESPLPRCFMMRFCIQNASQRHCRVTWSQTPWPAWHKPQYHIEHTHTTTHTPYLLTCFKNISLTSVFIKNVYYKTTGRNSMGIWSVVQ